MYKYSISISLILVNANNSMRCRNTLDQYGRNQYEYLLHMQMHVYYYNNCRLPFIDKAIHLRYGEKQKDEFEKLTNLEYSDIIVCISNSQYHT